MNTVYAGIFISINLSVLGFTSDIIMTDVMLTIVFSIRKSLHIQCLVILHILSLLKNDIMMFIHVLNIAQVVLVLTVHRSEVATEK